MSQIKISLSRLQINFETEADEEMFSYCFQVSRVECMLRLPSLDVVFSSKKADGEIHDEFANTFKTNPPAAATPMSSFSTENSDDDK